VVEDMDVENEMDWVGDGGIRIMVHLG
jgi:hypothetical protein